MPTTTLSWPLDGGLTLTIHYLRAEVQALGLARHSTTGDAAPLCTCGHPVGQHDTGTQTPCRAYCCQCGGYVACQAPRTVAPEGQALLDGGGYAPARPPGRDNAPRLADRMVRLPLNGHAHTAVLQETHVDAPSSPQEVEASPPDETPRKGQGGENAPRSLLAPQDGETVLAYVAYLHTRRGLPITQDEIRLALDRAQIPSRAPACEWQTVLGRAFPWVLGGEETP